MSDIRDEYIGRVVSGRSFAEVGGLWGTVNEKVSVAHKRGAQALAMFDTAPAGHMWWQKFEERRMSLGVPDVRCVPGDIIEVVEASDQTPHDVVHCSGVLYHMPDPLRLLTALRKLARRHVILTTVISQPRYENEEGVVDVPAGGVLFVPGLGARERAVLRQHWTRVYGQDAAVATFERAIWNVGDFGPWWFMPTVPALEGMCRAAGFDVIDSSPVWAGNAQTLLLGVRSAEVVD
jgi:hypothetical protein